MFLPEKMTPPGRTTPPTPGGGKPPGRTTPPPPGRTRPPEDGAALTLTTILGPDDPEVVVSTYPRVERVDGQFLVLWSFRTPHAPQIWIV